MQVNTKRGMLKEIIETKEYHENGTLMFTNRIGIVEPLFLDIYKKNKTLHKSNKDDNYYIILKREKFFNNGQFGWILEYDERGNSIGDKKQYRKDGTLII